MDASNTSLYFCNLLGAIVEQQLPLLLTKLKSLFFDTAMVDFVEWECVLFGSAHSVAEGIKKEEKIEMRSITDVTSIYDSYQNNSMNTVFKLHDSSTQVWSSIYILPKQITVYKEKKIAVRHVMESKIKTTPLLHKPPAAFNLFTALQFSTPFEYIKKGFRFLDSSSGIQISIFQIYKLAKLDLENSLKEIVNNNKDVLLDADENHYAVEMSIIAKQDQINFIENQMVRLADQLKSILVFRKEISKQ